MVEPSFGFIILRCVRTKQHDLLWKECYRCIRKFYDQEIIILDDNSIETLIDENIKLINTKVVRSEYPQRGELLPYIYFVKLGLDWSKAVFLHDSMFITERIDFESISDVKFLWHFHHPEWDKVNLEKQICTIMSSLTHEKELQKVYHDSKKWYGCFGAASVFDRDFARIVNEKHDISSLIPHVTDRTKRMCIERIIAVLAFAENKIEPVKGSIMGIIHDQKFGFGGMNYENYLKHGQSIKPLVKVWVGR